MYSDLRKASQGQTYWTKEQILAGIKHFFDLHGRYPTARDVDRFEYLPSSRSIQRSFGGLVTLRSELIPNSHANFTMGDYRSNIAKEANNRAQKYEEEFYNFLILHFQPLAIHEHKVIRPGNVSSDYFIYLTEKTGIIIDLFYAAYLNSLAGVVNIKLKRYSNLPFNTYFVLVGNAELDFHTLSDAMARRKVALPDNIIVDTESHFKESTIFALKQQSEFSI